jgi:DMSO/TMAO reductase YedYZ molybdopterin-dependent catalytic subunit
MSDDKGKPLERIVEARMKLMARFKEKMANSPSLADPTPLGSGPINRHGMPQLPTGQHEVEKWPVLDLGQHPYVPIDRWSLTIDGAVTEPRTLGWKDFLALPQVEDVSDFHCVTTWSKMDMRWKGVRFSTLAALAHPREDATHVLCHAYDGYTTNLSLEEALKDDVLLVHTLEGKPLPIEHGGPVRMITPQLYAWKGAKWISRIELTPRNIRGFWEQRGYSDTAFPWRDDRYSR